MKTIHITTIVAITLLSAGSAFAQGNRSQRGAGYGGPPKNDEERAARQQNCQNSNGGTCDGQGQQNGNGKRQRSGARDGSGPRDGSGACDGSGQRGNSGR